MIGGQRLPGLRDGASTILRFLIPEAFTRNLNIRHAEYGIVRSFGDFHVRRQVTGGAATAKWNAFIIFERRPRFQAGLDLIGENIRIARGFEYFFSHGTGGLMITVSIARAADKNRGNHQRANHSNDAYDVIEDTIMSPFTDGFSHGFGKAVIDYARPVLIDTVVAAGGEQFHGANKPEGIEIIGRHDVSAAFATIEC